MNVCRFVRAAVAAALFVPAVSEAQIVTTLAPAPAPSSDIGARLRWARTGWEASVYDSNPFDASTNLNPGGAPVWQVGSPYNFLVTFVSVTGTLGLDVDFNRDNIFGAGESVTRTSFTAPNGLTNYSGYGFRYLTISGNEGGSTARSTVTNLVVNGQNISNMVPNGTFLEQWFTNPNVNATGDFTITGALTFTTSGTGDERPSWDFRFREAVQGPNVVVPEPASLALLATGMAALVLVRRRRA
jgi:hypothetical protein